MTEREYVEKIKLVAESYIAVIRGLDAENDDHFRAVNGWDNIRSKLSPWIVSRMCDAWLEKNPE